MPYTVYQISVGDNRKYVGCTSNFKERIECHLKRAKYQTKLSNTPLYEAFKKTGLIDFEKLAICDTRKEAFQIEKRLIHSLNTLTPIGFNLSKSGQGNGRGARHRKVCDQFGKIYPSIHAAARAIGGSPGEVWRVASKKRAKSVKGFRFTYIEERMTRRAL